ncbi:hypothetical protein [Bradyrhizobium sp. AUGA SZCCT0431]|uniref:hypothetical protein n=1 Tax=Bradyrhizobium sp. AUGA SZCCT0431 TaxID=2807674 RepID=UPI001BA7BA28|nr:hypothetical protein [Bradyrhizobium sp. AUGA SZCCT0431]MBR1145202.1 hypothetical protein [Bradyrhizobium sp. AUGA SZCCT0431]
MSPLSGEDLINTVANEAREAAVHGQAAWRWEEGQEMTGCGRAFASFPLRHDSFDALINGRSGYRAQYYLSRDEGTHFNSTLIGCLMKPLVLACDRAPLPMITSLLRSFEGPHSKVWVLCDGGPFNAAPAGEFLRWAENNPISMGLRAPLPPLPAIEIKGNWITDVGQDYREDVTWKGDRHQWLSETGFV